MSGDRLGAADGTVRPGTADVPAAASGTGAADGTAPGAAHTDPASAAPAGSPAPLTSLTSLLGGSFEGGATCGPDGVCD